MLSPFSYLDAAVAGVCLTCHDAGRPEGCRRCARREPVVSAVSGEESPADRIAADTGRPFGEGGAYSSDCFEDWRGCVTFLLGEGLSEENCVAFLRSKHMRWCSDGSPACYGHATVADLTSYVAHMRELDRKEWGFPVARAASMMKTPEEMAAHAGRGASPLPAEVGAFVCGVRADRWAIVSVLEGIRSAHSAGGELEPVGYAAEVLGLVARMGVVT